MDKRNQNFQNIKLSSKLLRKSEYIENKKLNFQKKEKNPNKVSMYVTDS